MEQLPTELTIAIIRESVSLFVLLVFIFLSYKLLSKFGTEAVNLMSEIISVLNRIADK